jgi:hypothetical protein
MRVTYKAEGQLGQYSSIKESIELSVEIEDSESYPDTLEFLRSRVMDNLDEATRQRHAELKEKFDLTAIELLNLTQKLESAYKQWSIVSSFLSTQGLMTEVAEFPTEALNDLTKSLPTYSSSYPEAEGN